MEPNMSRQAGPYTEARPWGRWTVLEEGEGYKVKRIEVWPGHRLSLQVHASRSEHWVVVQGIALVTRGRESFTLKQHESTFIPQGTPHRLANPAGLPSHGRGDGLLIVIEVQVGEYLGEDDIVRLEDDYDRGGWAPSGEKNAIS